MQRKTPKTSDNISKSINQYKPVGNDLSATVTFISYSEPWSKALQQFHSYMNNYTYLNPLEIKQFQEFAEEIINSGGAYSESKKEEIRFPSIGSIFWTSKRLWSGHLGFYMRSQKSRKY